MREKMSLIALLVIAVPSSGTAMSAVPQGNSDFVDAPYECNVLKKKMKFRKRLQGIRAAGLFAIYKIELENRDAADHRVDYSCFCMVDGNGIEYEVNPYATKVRQTRDDDLHFVSDEVEVSGFDGKTVKSNFKLNGWLVFEVPGKDDYRIKFRGYSK